MPIESKNPASGQILSNYQELSQEQILSKIEKAKQTYLDWQFSSFGQRKKLMFNLADVLRQNRQAYASLITQEMGCPISQSLSEIEKCAIICEYYGEKAEEFLAPKAVNLSGAQAHVAFDPLGVILHVAPWNYPFYLALRPAIPAIMAGNTVVMKHASNVPQCSLALEEIFKMAGFSDGVFQSLLIGAKSVESVIRNPEISMVTLIGSEWAGSQVAKVAGEEIKKSVLELGGSDPFIVLAGADISAAVAGAVQSRLRNCGQSCNAAKRFIIHRQVAKEFIDQLKAAFEQEVIGDPMDIATTIGPLATENSLLDIQRQVQESVKMGAKILTGGQTLKNLPGYYYPPTILIDVTAAMPVFQEEVFGPVAPIMVVDSEEEAIKVANNSQLGLGASVWTNDLDVAKNCVRLLETGNVYINAIVRGDPKLPYGGIKRSGYGREFGDVGIQEFVNIKSVVIK